MNGMYVQFDNLGGIVAGAILGSLFSMAFSLAFYVLQSLGLYTIADRRGIKHSWLAWLPIANTWILGSIADQYQYVAKGQIRSRRKVLLGINIAMAVLTVVLIGSYISVIARLISNALRMGQVSEKMLEELLMTQLLSMLGICCVMLILAVIATVFQYIAYYNLFASCNPKYEALFTVLGILFPVTLPFFVFACRNKDLGMPPRKTAARQFPEQPVTETPKEDFFAEEQ